MEVATRVEVAVAVATAQVAVEVAATVRAEVHMEEAQAMEGQVAAAEAPVVQYRLPYSRDTPLSTSM